MTDKNEDVIKEFSKNALQMWQVNSLLLTLEDSEFKTQIKNYMAKIYTEMATKAFQDYWKNVI